MKHNPERKTQIELQKGVFQERKVIMIFFEYKQSIIEMLRTFKSAWWNPDLHCWCIPRDIFDLDWFKVVMGPTAEIDDSKLFENTTTRKPILSKPEQSKQKTRKKPEKKDVQLPDDYLEKLERRRYSPNTIATYTSYFKDFIREFGFENLESISVKEIKAYLHRLISYNKISKPQQDLRVSSIKFYYEKVLGRDKEYYQIERPRKSRILPKVLSEKEILAMLSSTINLKHKAIIGTIYSSGLRRSELINLRIEM